MRSRLDRHQLGVQPDKNRCAQDLTVAMSSCWMSFICCCAHQNFLPLRMKVVPITVCPRPQADDVAAGARLGHAERSHVLACVTVAVRLRQQGPP